jgi:hypothetical protein
MGTFIARWLTHDRGGPDWLVYIVCVMFGGIVTLAYAIHSAPALREWRRPDFPVPKSGSEVDIVDSELRVLGLEGWRVVAASVMPTITHGNTNARR